MKLRRQLPVYSPLTLDAVLRGGAAALGWGAGAGERSAEALIRERYAPRALLRTDSGTSALALAIRGAAARSPGLPVALPAYCCYDVATAAVGAEVPVVLYDVDPQTLAPSAVSLRAALAGGASAVVVVHLYGIPVSTAEVSPLAAAAGAVVIDDAAQGTGAVLDGRPLGVSGSLGVLSFGRGKGTTGGGGGALLANDAQGEAALAAVRGRLQPARAGAREVLTTGAQWLLGRPGLYGIPSSLPFLGLGETAYHPPAAPTGAPTATAAVLGATWRLSEREGAIRRANAARLLDAVRESSWLSPVEAAIGTPGYLRLPVLVEPARRDEIARARGLGVMPGYPTPLSRLKPFAPNVLNRATSVPGAESLAERLCTIPTHSRLTEEDLRSLEGWIRSPYSKPSEP